MQRKFFFLIFAADFFYTYNFRAYVNNHHSHTTADRHIDDIHRCQSWWHRFRHLRHGGCIHLGVRLWLEARFHPHRREEDPEYQRRLREGLLKEDDTATDDDDDANINPNAKWAVMVFLLGVLMVVIFGIFPSLLPSYDGEPLDMSTTIEIIMMSIAALILIVGKASVTDAAKGNVFASGMNAMVAIFGVAWMGSTFFEGHHEVILGSVLGIFGDHPMLFAIPLFVFSIMLFSQAATVKTLFPVGLAIGVPPLVMLVLFPTVNGYFFLPNYPTEVAAIGFDRTGTTRIGKYVINHSFQLAGFITTIVALAVGTLIVEVFY